MNHPTGQHGAARLDALRAALAERARMPGTGGMPGAGCVATGWPEADDVLGGGIPCHGLHEWWGAMPDARAVCVQLAWRAIAQDDRAQPGAWRHVAWVGRDAWPAPGDLVRGLRAPLAWMFGGKAARSWPDARLHDRSLLVDVPPHDAGARLWAIEQAARCGGVCAVVADGRGLDLAATRRLQLAASGVLLLALRGPERRPGARRASPSACATRWTVARAPGPVPAATEHLRARVPWLQVAHPLAARIPPEPAWEVTLERAKGGAASLRAECRVRAFHGWQWEGMAGAPAAEAAEASRRAERVARLGAERERRRDEARRACAAADAEYAPGIAMPADADGRRGRPRGARDRMTSRGERWARHVEGHVA